MGAIGSIGAYWVGTFAEAAINFSSLAFLVPALLLFNIGFPLFGAGTIRAKMAPWPGAWLLAAGGFPGIPLLTVLTGQLTLALVLLNLAGWCSDTRCFRKGKLRRASPRKRGEREGGASCPRIRVQGAWPGRMVAERRAIGE